MACLPNYFVHGSRLGNGSHIVVEVGNTLQLADSLNGGPGSKAPGAVSQNQLGIGVLGGFFLDIGKVLRICQRQLFHHMQGDYKSTLIGDLPGNLRQILANIRLKGGAVGLCRDVVAFKALDPVADQQGFDVFTGIAGLDKHFTYAGGCCLQLLQEPFIDLLGNTGGLKIHGGERDQHASDLPITVECLLLIQEALGGSCTMTDGQTIGIVFNMVHIMNVGMHIEHLRRNKVLEPGQQSIIFLGKYKIRHMVIPFPHRFSFCNDSTVAHCFQ